MINLLGPRDDFLRILEEQLQADLHVRGGRITLSGEAADVAKAAEVLDELITILRTGQGLTGETVERVIQMSEDPTAAASEILTQNIVSSRGKTVRPKTLNQKRYVDAIDAHRPHLRQVVASRVVGEVGRHDDVGRQP